MAGKSWLKLDKLDITPEISVYNPTIGEVLDDEQNFYGVASTLTSVPYQYMVQLDDMGIDFTEITEWQFFQMMFLSYVKQNEETGENPLSLLFVDLDLNGFDAYVEPDTEQIYLFNPNTGAKIDELVYADLMKVLRKLNNFEHVKAKPGNEHAKAYLIEKERRKQRRNKNKPYEPYLERLVISMVNTPEFKYNYEQTMDMRLYTFNQSFLQVSHKITFD